MAIIKKIVDKETLDAPFTVPKAIIFKNSTRCPISFAAKKRFEEFAGSCDEETELYMINVIENRKLSNEISERTGIKHESPQVILLKNGQPQWGRTHLNISIDSLKEAVLIVHGIEGS